MFKEFNNRVSKTICFFGYLSGLGIFIMGILILFEVISRYVFKSPTVWSQEISIYLFIWSMFAGAAYTLQKGKHVHIDLFINKLSKHVQSRLRLITSIMALWYTIIVCKQGYKMVVTSIKYHKLSPTPLHMPMVVPKFALLLGFIFLMLQFIVIIVDECNFILNSKKV
ncbi:MAG TPA: TRAP transporter small permease [Candidatus Atribacteria bacterium]|nr:TRAP transporter small permease [Candidatus Atribacteria bacterium]